MAEQRFQRLLSSAEQEAVAAIRHAHDWLQKHEQLNCYDPAIGRRRGYIGLDHALGENDDACTLCHAVAALEGPHGSRE